MSKKGFTLIELLTVIAIIGILVLLAAPKFLGYTEKANIVKIQTGIKSLETVIDLNSIKNPDLTKDWVVLTPEEINEINDSGKLLDRQGFIKEDLKEGSQYIPLEKTQDFDSIKWNSGGTFVLGEDGESVYYYNKDYNVSKDNTNSNKDIIKSDGTLVKPDGSVILSDGSTFPVAKEEEFTWVPSTWSDAYEVPEKGTGYYKYSGESDTVVIPNKIDGYELTSYYKMFDSTSVKKVISYNEKVKDLSNMFSYTKSTSLDLSNFDASNVVKMNNIFNNTQATSINLSNFDTSNVVDMYGVFSSPNITSLDLSEFDTSNVENMSNMFSNSTLVLDLSNFDTSNVTNMKAMFYNVKMESLDLTSLETSNVIDMNSMFSTSIITSLNLSGFDTLNVVDMERMFYSAKGTVLDLSSFDTSNSTNMKSMFSRSEFTIGYAKTLEDADRFNSTSSKPTGLDFTVK